MWTREKFGETRAIQSLEELESAFLQQKTEEMEQNTKDSQKAEEQ